MNDDMPWVDLTPEEIQELRTKKHELTEYGKQKIRQLMTHEEMLEEAARREKENQVLEIAKNFMEEHSDAMKQLAKIEHQELAQELALELRSWSQNEEMIDQYFTKHGIICNQAADLLELFAKYQDSE
jgi:hypothetical protein